MNKIFIFGMLATLSHNIQAQVAGQCQGNAFLVNSSSSSGNHCDFYRDLDRANRSIETFSCKKTYAAVDDHLLNGLDCSKYSKEDWENKKTWEYEQGIKTTKKLFSDNGDKNFENSNLKKDILAAVESDPKQPMLFYFTDHGGKDGNYFDIRNAGESTISFGDSELKFDEYWKFIQEIQAKRNGQNLVMMHDHCFSEGMLKGFVQGVDPKTKTLKVIPGVCGAAAATETEFSYTNESLMKHTDRMNVNKWASKDKDANGKINLTELYDSYEYGYYSSSTPIKSSDIFLNEYALNLWPKDYTMKFKYDDLKGSLNQELENLWSQCNQSMDPLGQPAFDEVTIATMKILTNDLANNYLKFLNPSAENKANYYNGAGFKEGLNSYEEIQLELDRTQGVLIKINDDFHKLTNDYHQKLLTLWSPQNAQELKRLQNLYNDKMNSGLLEEGIKIQAQMHNLQNKFIEWTVLNEQKSQDLWDKEFQPKQDLLSSKWTATQKQASGIRRLKKTVDSLNGLAILAKRKDFTGLKNLMNIIECEKTELINL